MGALDDAPLVKWALEVGGPAAPDSLDSERIALSNSPTTVDYYANAAWIGRAPVMLQSLLVQAFEASSGKIRKASVPADTSALHSDYMLGTDIRDFEAQYATKDSAPKVVVSVEAKLFRTHARDIVASLSATQEAQAGTNSVDSVVMAFNEATGALLKQIVEWALHAPAPKKAESVR